LRPPPGRSSKANLDGYRKRELRIEPADLDRLVQVQAAIEEAKGRRELAREQAASVDDLLTEIEQMANDPLAWFDELRAERKGLVCKLVPEKCRRRGHRRRPYRTFKVVRFKARSLIHGDTYILSNVKIRPQSCERLAAVRPRLELLFGDA
jgi:hypothetical protein